jgi:hypothetical protein
VSFHSIARYALIIAVLALPFSMAIAQLAVRHDATLTDLSPAPYPNGVYGDSLFYWHQSGTFARVGIDGGYYSTAERVAPLSVSPFYAWGIFVPAFYGRVGALFGWQMNSIPLINLLLLTLALAAYIAVVRPNVPQLMLLGGFVVASNALHIHYATSMTTVLNLALGVLLAACFTRALASDSQRTRWLWTTGYLAAFAALIQPVWGMLLVFVLAYGWRASQRGIIAGIAVGAILFIGLTVLVQATATVYPHTSYFILDALRTAPPRAFELLFANIASNARTAFEGSIVDLGTRAQTVVGALAAVVTGVRGAKTTILRWEYAFHAWNLGSIYLFMWIIYDQFGSRDVRQFAPRLLLSALVLIAMKRLRLAMLLLVTMIVLLPFGLYEGGAWTEGHISRDGHAFYTQTRATLERIVPFQAGASSPWCNSVMLSFVYVNELPGVPLAFPFGMGLSWGVESMQPESVQARYLLLTDEDAARFPDGQLRALQELPGGKLYLNIANLCLP